MWKTQQGLGSGPKPLSARACRAGDTLFALGCGRLFEGTPKQMWQVCPDAAYVADSAPLQRKYIVLRNVSACSVNEPVKCRTACAAVASFQPCWGMHVLRMQILAGSVCCSCLSEMHTTSHHQLIMMHSICSHFCHCFLFGHLLGAPALA